MTIGKCSLFVDLNLRIVGIVRLQPSIQWLSEYRLLIISPASLRQDRKDWGDPTPLDTINLYRGNRQSDGKRSLCTMAGRRLLSSRHKRIKTHTGIGKSTSYKHLITFEEWQSWSPDCQLFHITNLDHHSSRTALCWPLPLPWTPPIADAEKKIAQPAHLVPAPLCYNWCLHKKIIIAKKLRVSSYYNTLQNWIGTYRHRAQTLPAEDQISSRLNLLKNPKRNSTHCKSCCLAGTRWQKTRILQRKQRKEPTSLTSQEQTELIDDAAKARSAKSQKQGKKISFHIMRY